MLSRTLGTAIFLAMAIFSKDALANIDIPVTSGPNPTCVSRLYSDILVPTGWGNGNDAATNFVQSPEGTLGVTIFFEIGPYGDLSSYSSTGTQAMQGVGEVSINRWRNDDTIENVNNHGEQSKGGIIAVIKESAAWHHETYHGEGTLLQAQRNRFYNILNGDPQSLDCRGLLGSWVIGQSIIAQYYGTSHPPTTVVSWPNPPAQLSLYYGSSDFGSEQLPGVSTVNQQYVVHSASWSVPRYLSSDYEENFFLLSNARARSGFPPFI